MILPCVVKCYLEKFHSSYYYCCVLPVDVVEFLLEREPKTRQVCMFYALDKYLIMQVAYISIQYKDNTPVYAYLKIDSDFVRLYLGDLPKEIEIRLLSLDKVRDEIEYLRLYDMIMRSKFHRICRMYGKECKIFQKGIRYVRAIRTEHRTRLRVRLEIREICSRFKLEKGDYLLVKIIGKVKEQPVEVHFLTRVDSRCRFYLRKRICEILGFKQGDLITIEICGYIKIRDDVKDKVVY